MFFGIDNGVPAAALPPKDFAPTSQGDQLQWPAWGQYYETKGDLRRAARPAGGQAADGALH